MSQPAESPLPCRVSVEYACPADGCGRPVVSFVSAALAGDGAVAEVRCEAGHVVRLGGPELRGLRRRVLTSPRGRPGDEADKP